MLSRVRSPFARTEARARYWGRYEAELVRRRHLYPRRRTRRQQLVLFMANAYASAGGMPELSWFSEQVAGGSNGEVKIELVHSWTSTRDSSEERTITRDVMRGRVDLCWVGTRLFGALGVRSLDPLEAPFLLSDYASQARVLESGIAREMLEPLDTLGLRGLAVLAGRSRKPFAFSAPLREADDYRGKTIRIHESAIARATFAALGATPVLLSAEQVPRAHRLGIAGMDLDAASLAGWGFSGYFTANVDLWPRTLAIVAGRRRFEALGADERQLIEDAAAHVAAKTVAALRHQNERDRDHLTRSGVEVVQASSEQIEELRARVAHVHDELRRDALSGPLLRRVEMLL